MHRIAVRVAALGVAILALVASPAQAQDAQEEAKIKKWLEGYVAALNAKDLKALGSFYDEQATIYEGGSIDNGWASYRDHHLGPELKEFQNLQFALVDVTPHVPEKGAKVAWVTATYTLKAKMKDRDIDSAGLETMVLVKDKDGSWKIRHSHTSSRRRPAPQAPTQAKP
ncbi:YybH family protein [Hyalangium rubrum]|uniref:Nuclear transport factor 2 family protein n=1 Tax=Hyalangium rubrum TaxID=3103134 RepID=A0ABU5H951_9BACT|nr:nuclear transport factor 2 family protein [Hyalangium sp. s54d21]MDY7229845.1 nuclear transport factor 2 family protein [Hyalangium sp. s54d21]